ncbi:MAG: sigma 54-interacting transcriptional regulator, partial [Mariprofundaceae bacterium]|nr:sigma 54-interacting transcriptional regulator [Mariprofundaceae bacterium]
TLFRSRKNLPCVGINCASIPENLLESELFGFRKGAFTSADRNKSGLLEEVGEGSLFLDEIGDMPLPLQAKLLHVLDDGSFRPLGSTKDQKFTGRIIAATNVDLASLIHAKAFRSDLFYRISVLSIDIPPLRQRPDDLLALAERLYAELAAQMGKKVSGLPFGLAEEIQQGQWPGNVRELRNYLERSLIFEDATGNGEHMDMSLSHAVNRFERAWIERVVDECGGDKTLAAGKLGLGLSTLYRKLEV